MSRLKPNQVSKLTKGLNEQQKKIAEEGAVYSVKFLGIVSLPTTVISAHGFVQDAMGRMEKEKTFSPKDAYIAMDNNDIEVWEQDTLDAILQISVNQVEYTGDIEGNYKKSFAIVFRHRTGCLFCPCFTSKESGSLVPKEIGQIFAKANKFSNNPATPLPGSAGHTIAAEKHEVLEKAPWFVGKTPRKAVEDALTVGLVGDYVVRASESTPNAYVLVIKLRPLEFIEHKILKLPNGKYQVQGKPGEYPTIGLIIKQDLNATRAAKGVVLGELLQPQKEGGVSRARRASVSGVREQGKLDIETDVKAYDTVYLGFEDILQKISGVSAYKEVIKQCVLKNSETRQKLRRLAKESKSKYAQAKASRQFSNVHEEMPVTIVITPKLIRIVDRLSGESLVKAFINNVPFTLEAPSRDAELDKFIFVRTNPRGSVASHIFNVPHGLGHVLAEAISYYIEQAEDNYSASNIAKTNPFAPTGKRLAAPQSLFAKQIHRIDIKAVKPIGAGQFGEVWLAEQTVRLPSGKTKQIPRAVKMLKSNATHSARNEFVREAETMLKFDHDNVTRIVGVAVQQPPWLSVLEYMQYGNIRDVVVSADQKGVELSVAEKMDMCYQLCKGCGYVSSIGLVHMDIAARNVLLGHENLIKLADFGLTRPMDPNCTYYRLKEKLAISIKWAALEALERKCFDEKTDVWSFGITSWEIFNHGAVPFREVPLAHTVKQLRGGLRPGRPDDCPPDVWSIIAKTWDSNAGERPNFKTIESLFAGLFQKYQLPSPRRDVGAVIDAASMQAK
eukprot:m.29413 g.29413  ORF g.29413 m.29413 type:complete len:785 (-) comp8099_c0_seq4:166-2520(-)